MVGEQQEQPKAPEDEVREMLDQGYPETWNWEEHGPEVVGYAVRKEVGQTVNGPCDILILKVKNPDTGEYEHRSVWLFHTALVSKMYRLRPMIGDLVGIRQLGEREPQGGGRPYMDYNVVVYGQKGGALDWGPQQVLPPSTSERGPVDRGEPEVVDAEVVGDNEEPAASGASGSW